MCVGNFIKEDLDVGCKILRRPQVSCYCEPGRRVYHVATPNFPSMWMPLVHGNCIHNLHRACVGRVIGKTPGFDPRAMAELQLAARKVRREIRPTGPMPIEDVPLLYTGRKRTLYQRAVDSLCDHAITNRDAFLKCFVKAERFNPEAKTNPDPRMIQYRGPRYAMVLAHYLKPIEHAIYRMDCFSSGVTKTRNIAKGLNHNERAQALLTKMEQFRRPLVLSLDASRFDKHVSKELLRVEHSIYLAANHDPEFKRILDMQLVNRVYGAEGSFVYKTSGRRMSGDMNTALGNCITMLIMVLSAMLKLALTKFDTFDDGDDCLLIVEEEDEPLTMQLPSIFLRYGMVLKLENRATTPEGVLFCQSRPLLVRGDTWKMVRDPWKIMSTALVGVRHWEDPNYRRKTIAAVGLCELVLNLGVPVLQSYASALLRNAKVIADLRYASDGRRASVIRQARVIGVPLDKLKPQVIHGDARESFAKAWGMTPSEQRQMENWLDNWSFNIAEAEMVGEWFSVERWEVYDYRRPQFYA